MTASRRSLALQGPGSLLVRDLLVGYAVTVVAWGVTRLGRGRLADAAAVVLFAGVVGGVLLSGYLTFLEPLVVGATCAWCLGGDHHRAHVADGASRRRGVVTHANRSLAAACGF